LCPHWKRGGVNNPIGTQRQKVGNERVRYKIEKKKTRQKKKNGERGKTSGKGTNIKNLKGKGGGQVMDKKGPSSKKPRGKKFGNVPLDRGAGGEVKSKSVAGRESKKTKKKKKFEGMKGRPMGPETVKT